MKTEQEAKEAWEKEIDKMSHNFDGIHAIETEKAFDILSDFQTSLIEALEEDKGKYIHIRDGWKEHSKDWEVYDLAVRICDKHIELVKTITTKK